MMDRITITLPCGCQYRIDGGLPLLGFPLNCCGQNYILNIKTAETAEDGVWQ